VWKPTLPNPEAWTHFLTSDAVAEVLQRVITAPRELMMT